MENEEPQDISSAKGGFKKPVLALNIEKDPFSSRSKEAGLMEEVKKLKKRVRKLEAFIGRIIKIEQGSSQNQKRGIQCYVSAKMGHFPQDC